MSKHTHLRWIAGGCLSLAWLVAGTPSRAQDAMRELTNAVNSLRTEVRQLSSKVDNVVSKDELKAEIERMEGNIDALTDSVRTLSRKVDQISTTNNGQTHPKILGNMQSNPDFRREMTEAVERSLRSSGTLVVRNETPNDHQLVVNGTTRLIPRFQTMELEVPAGTLVAHLMGFEPPKHWTIAPPTYRQVIGIRY
jgi:outer membrane murein-binding lipoprotein Lpp